MKASVNANVLSASSLLLAAVAAFYTLWYSEICQARDMPVKSHRADRNLDIKAVVLALRMRALPLLVTCVTLWAIFAPTAITICVTSVEAFSHSPLNAIKHYDTVRAAFLAVWIFEGALALLSLDAPSEFR
jgi:hypothetical protein